MSDASTGPDAGSATDSRPRRADVARSSRRRSRRRQARYPQQVGQQFRIYLHRIGWIVSDLLRQFPHRVFALTALHAAGVAAGGATIGMILLYARHLDAGGPIGFGPVSLPEPTGMTAMLIGLVVALLGISAASCVYLGEWLIARLTVGYQRECERRLFRIVGDPACRGWAALLPGSATGQLNVLGSSGCKIMALCVRRLMRAGLPMLMLVAAATALVITDWLMTLLLLPVGLVYLVPLYLVNRGAARTQRAYKAASPPVRRSVRKALSGLAAHGPEAGAQARAGAERALDQPGYFKAGMLFFQRRLAVEQITLLNTAFFVTAVMALFTYAAVNAEGPEWSWTRLVVYLLALRFAVGSMQSVTSVFVRLSRLLPEYGPYIEFVRDAEQLRQRRRSAPPPVQAPLEGALTFRCRRPKLPDAAEQVTVQRPGPLWVLLPWSPDRPDLEAAAVRLQKPLRSRKQIDLLALACFHDGSNASVEPTELAALVAGIEPGRWRAFFDELGVLDELQPWLAAAGVTSPASEAEGGASPVAEAADLDELSREAVWALRGVSLCAAAPLVFLAARPVAKLDRGVRRRLAKFLHDRYVVLVTDEPALALKSPLVFEPAEAGRVIVLGAEKVVGSGDLPWLTEHLEAVAALLEAEDPKATSETDLEDDA